MQAETGGLSRFGQNLGRVSALSGLAGAAFVMAATMGAYPAFAACGSISSVQNTGVHSAAANSGVHSGTTPTAGSTHSSTLSSCPSAATVGGIRAPANGKVNSAALYHVRNGQAGKMVAHLGSSKTATISKVNHP